MSTLTQDVSLTITATTEKELQEKEAAIKILSQNLNRDSLIILANKSRQLGVNEKIKKYQQFM